MNDTKIDHVSRKITPWHDPNNFIPKLDPKDPAILDAMARYYTPRIVGEHKNKKTMIACILSKDLPPKYRMSMIISNRSSTGKSNFVNNILAPFTDDVIDFTDFSDAYLKRSGFIMNGKIFKLEQMERKNENGQVSISSLKFLLSEGLLKIGIAEKNDKDQFEPRTLQVTGIPVFISTTTKFDIDSETANRVFIMQLDESDTQTEKITAHTLKSYATLGVDDAWEQNLEDLKNLYKKYKKMAHHVNGILIPFSEKLQEVMPKNVEIRRDLKKILNLTCSIAFIRGLRRRTLADTKPQHYLADSCGKTEKRDTYYIIAEPEDFIESLEIADSTIKQTMNKVNHTAMKIYEVVTRLSNEKEKEYKSGVTVKEVSNEVGLSENRTREYLTYLENNGYVIRDRNEKEHRFHQSTKEFSDIKSSALTFTEEEFQTWLKKTIEGNENRFHLLVPSCYDTENTSVVVGQKELESK